MILGNLEVGSSSLPFGKPFCYSFTVTVSPEFLGLLQIPAVWAALVYSAYELQGAPVVIGPAGELPQHLEAPCPRALRQGPT